jgi:hypothetical protein
MATASERMVARTFQYQITRLTTLCQRVIDGHPSDVEAGCALTAALSSEPSPLTPPRLSHWVDALTAEARRRADVLDAEPASVAFRSMADHLHNQLLVIQRVVARNYAFPRHADDGVHDG